MWQIWKLPVKYRLIAALWTLIAAVIIIWGIPALPPVRSYLELYIYSHPSAVIFILLQCLLMIDISRLGDFLILRHYRSNHPEAEV